MFMSLLATHKDIWRKVLEHVRDYPEKPFLLHCTGTHSFPDSLLP